jgi:hypothetical protein
VDRILGGRIVCVGMSRGRFVVGHNAKAPNKSVYHRVEILKDNVKSRYPGPPRDLVRGKILKFNFFSKQFLETFLLPVL